MVTYDAEVEDDVFRALADPTRRSLLDELFREDGQSLSSLEARVTMTRFGVMKHLRILEAAGLIVVQRRGREKLHFLNAVPIRLINDRWVSKFSAVWADGLIALKHDLEKTMEKVYEIYIKTTPERLWQAITETDLRAKYSFGARFLSDVTPDSSYETMGGDAQIAFGRNVEVDPPNKLVQTFNARWDDEVALEPESIVTWLITPVGDSCCLTVTHAHLRENGSGQIYGGWPMILSGLKTLLETGELLTTPGSLYFMK